MKHYTAEVEAAARGPLVPDTIDDYMEALAEYAPSISETPRGHHAARITLPADSLAQAAQTALRVAEAALGPLVRLDIMTEAEADARDGEVEIPDLIGVTAAASLLDVSPQRLRQMIAEGKLAACRIGERSYALLKSEVVAKAAS